MFNLPVFVGIDYHTHSIQVCVMDSQRKILTNESVPNDPESVSRLVATFGDARREEWENFRYTRYIPYEKRQFS
jgi:predicted NBD/HSP70 family sugar kinase